MNIKTCLLTSNDCYGAGRTIVPKGIMVHSTGSNNPTLKRYVQPDDGLLGVNQYGNHWNRDVGVCVHAFIGKLANGSVATYQTLPWNHRAWHCGDAANSTHISFEICEDGLKDEKYFFNVYQEAVELTAYLCQMYNLNPLEDGVVICHSEGYQRGIASNHGDVMHWFPKFGKSMDTFRADVFAKMNESGEEEVTQEQFGTMMDTWIAKQAELMAPDWSDAEYAEAKAMGITDGKSPMRYATRLETAIMVKRGAMM